jgi:hypothetical protein
MSDVGFFDVGFEIQPMNYATGTIFVCEGYQEVLL